MKIGVPRERKPGERRVALTPELVSVLVGKGHSVMIEQGAGELSSYSTSDYQSAGANIGETLESVWSFAELLIKVKEPAQEEVAFFRPNLAVFSFLHLAVVPELTREMVQRGVTGLDYDLVMLPDGRLPVLEPMSIIAGKLSVQCGAYALQAGNGGRGILLGGSVGVRPAKVVVLGAGAAGSNAAKVAIGMGAEVTVLDIRPERLAPFCEGYLRARTVLSNEHSIRREIADADLVIGAVLIPGALAPKLISKKMLSLMRPGSVVVDICIDQGGCLETSRATTIDDPTYVEPDSQVVHYCVTNMPALVPRTSTEALTSATQPWILLLSECGIEETLRRSSAMRASLTSYRGKLTNEAIGKAVRLQAADEKEVLAMLQE